MSSTSQKPLVVLAGWMGCQKRSLRRYGKFFSELGYQVHSTVAPTPLIVASCFSDTSHEPLQYPPQWPVHQDAGGSVTTSLQGFAWETLRDIHNQDCDHFIFCAFSNGGCFVWEQISRILNNNNTPILQQVEDDEAHPLSPLPQNGTSDMERQQQILAKLKKKTAGVIFDSCPSQNLSAISKALAVCTLRDRLEIMVMPDDKGGGLDVAFFPSMVSANKKQRAEKRSNVYYQGLQADPWNIPHLYLYSENDILIPSQGIDELYDYRRQTMGSHRILRRKFESSRHCAHLIDNEEEYSMAVNSFLEISRQFHHDNISGSKNSLLGSPYSKL
jgi:Eukaryotic protein of unknown function (DUF829)